MNRVKTILNRFLSKTMDKVRAIDLSQALGFSRPTVSVMLRELRENGFVAVSREGGIALTAAGLAVATRMYERHCIVSEVLMTLGVSREVALEDACRIEHVISDESFEAIKRHAGR